MIVIGLGHKARHGKDSLAKALHRRLITEGVDAKRYAFGDDLKAVARICFGMTTKDGPLLQLVGTECFRDGEVDAFFRALTRALPDVAPQSLYQGAHLFVAMRNKLGGQECWVNALRAKITDEKPEVAIVTDMRFINEAEMIKSLGGILVDIRRINKDNSPYVAGDRDPNHRSEVELDDYPVDYRWLVRSGDMAMIESHASELATEILCNREDNAGER